VPAHELDDELISCYLDGELSPTEAAAVQRLVESEAAWAKRLAVFRADSSAIRKLPVPELTESQRELVFELVKTNLGSGAERRRVPRFRRRWMLVIAFLVPAALTLFFFQNPNSTSRLYLKKDGLELQAGRSIAEEEFGPDKTWRSPKLWGQYFPGDDSFLSFQVDAEKLSDRKVEGKVFYDFNGDGNFERSETYEPVKLDARRGWERFKPALSQSHGEFKHFEGGEILVTLKVLSSGDKPIKISGTPGELILPYRGLRSSKGSYDQ
jgi:hypothetical protein